MEPFKCDPTGSIHAMSENRNKQSLNVSDKEGDVLTDSDNMQEMEGIY